MLLCHIERVSVDYQHLRVQCDTKACYILFIVCLTFDVDIQY